LLFEGRKISKDTVDSPTTWLAMGLPFCGFSGNKWNHVYKMAGSQFSIKFWTSLIMLPWTLKPLGSLLEMFKTKVLRLPTQIFTGCLFWFCSFKVYSCQLSLPFLLLCYF
jgi:PAT family beta-lactamase induction signal transducer AmpG